MSLLSQLSVKGKKVLLRLDLNVPISPQGIIEDDERIRAALKTINYLLDQGAALILMSHLGDPKERDPKSSLQPVAKRLEKLLGRHVQMAHEVIGHEAENLSSALKPGELLLLENLRFCPEEKEPSLAFAKRLAALGDIYINDAFGTAHRNHTSITLLPSLFKEKGIGFLMERELSILTRYLKEPKRPFSAIIGGAKIHSKIELLLSLTKKADSLYIGGGMLFPLLKVRSIPIGNSLFEKAQLPLAEKFLQACEEESVNLHLPLDLLITRTVTQGAPTESVLIDEGIPDGYYGVDVGPKTVENWKQSLKNAQTIFWNGPLGIFEIPDFSNGTFMLAKILSQLPSIRIVGGGDSLSAISQLNLKDSFTHLSTGGGATLKWLEQGKLVALESIESL